jgi:hypothetical protein
VVGNLQTLVLITVDQVVLHEDLILEILNKLGSSSEATFVVLANVVGACKDMVIFFCDC